MADTLTVKDVSLITGLTVRTLQYYDKIDLLKPSDYSKAGYRLYSKENLKKLQLIMLFKELEFPLKEIKNLLSSNTFDKQMPLIPIKLSIIKSKQKKNGEILFSIKSLRNAASTDQKLKNTYSLSS